MASARTLPSSSGAPRARGPSPFTLDPKATDIGTGAYVALGAVGAVVRRKDGEILLARLGEKPTSLPDDGSTFSRTRSAIVDHGDASVVYFVADGKLQRRVIDREGKISPAEAVATDAEDGYPPHGVREESTKVAAPLDLVGYVARRTTKDGERRARVWVEGKGAHDLSPDGSGGASVFLSLLAPGRVAAVWLDQRSALAPIHTAAIDLDGAGEPRITGRTIVWISPPSDLMGVVTAVRADTTLVALIATQKNGADFGLAAAPIAFGAPPLADAAWLDYPNGLDPAPAVPARFCDRPAVVIVRPSDRPADAPKIVAIATVEADGRITESVEVARAGRVDHVAAWAGKAEGWVAWVGDGRTKVRRVKCGK